MLINKSYEMSFISIIFVQLWNINIFSFFHNIYALPLEVKPTVFELYI